MFEDQNQNPSAPKNLPTEPVDMFAGVDKSGGGETTPATAIPDALSAGLLKKKPEVTTMPVGAESVGQPASLENYRMKGPILGKILILLFVIILLGIGAFLGWWFLYGKNNYAKPTVTAPESSVPAPSVGTDAGVVPVSPGAGQSETLNTGTPADIPAKMNNDQILFGEAVDTDKDGLDDVREKEIGTDHLNPDTDKDELSDGDEVIIWKTNPLNPDSDGDSYPDGTEVKNGYNPLGPGKLFNLPANATPSPATSS